MVIRRLYTAYSLLTFLEQETLLTRQLTELLTVEGRFPTRRTWEQRLATLPDGLPALVGRLGRLLVELLRPWACCGRAVVLDSTPLRAKGRVWHQKDRAAGVVPHTTIDTEAHWSRSGYHGWWYGWKLHLASTVAAVWIPLAAELTPANRYDGQVAPALMAQLPLEARFVLGDTHYNSPRLKALCAGQNRILVAAQKGPHPHTAVGALVRQVFHQLRTRAIEPFIATGQGCDLGPLLPIDEGRTAGYGFVGQKLQTDCFVLGRPSGDRLDDHANRFGYACKGSTSVQFEQRQRSFIGSGRQAAFLYQVLQVGSVGIAEFDMFLFHPSSLPTACSWNKTFGLFQ